jgi:hypothetical protein
MDAVGMRVPTRQTREFPAFGVSNALRHGHQLCAPLLKMTYADFWTYLAKTKIPSPLRAVSLSGKGCRLIISYILV